MTVRVAPALEPAPKTKLVPTVSHSVFFGKPVTSKPTASRALEGVPPKIGGAATGEGETELMPWQTAYTIRLEHTVRQRTRRFLLAGGVACFIIICLAVAIVLVSLEVIVVGADDDSQDVATTVDNANPPSIVTYNTTSGVEVVVSTELTWTYNTDNAQLLAPSQWYQAYSACGGPSQSPVDLLPVSSVMRAMDAELALVTSGVSTRFFGEESDRGWAVTGLATEGKLKLDHLGVTYTLAHFEFHAPSEHTVLGRHFDAEVQFVYQGANGRPGLIIAVFLDSSLDEENAFLAKFWPYFDNKQHDLQTGFNPYTEFFPNNKAHYRYIGSLTTPDCTEGIPWLVFLNAVHISSQQLHAFTSALVNLPQTYSARTNNRPVQALNGRGVETIYQLDWKFGESDGGIPGQDEWASKYESCGQTGQSPVNLPQVSANVRSWNSDIASQLVVEGSCTRYLGASGTYMWSIEQLDTCDDGRLKMRYQKDGEGNVTTYTLTRIEFKAPSEHTVSWRHFAGEAQLVYQTEDGQRGPIIAVFLDDSEDIENGFLANFWPHFNNQRHQLGKGINPYDDLFPTFSSYYTYGSGSTTTPPCELDVPWIIFTNPVPISTLQLNSYRAAMGGMPQTTDTMTNNRPTQDAIKISQVYDKSWNILGPDGSLTG